MSKENESPGVTSAGLGCTDGAAASSGANCFACMDDPKASNPKVAAKVNKTLPFLISANDSLWPNSALTPVMP